MLRPPSVTRRAYPRGFTGIAVPGAVVAMVSSAAAQQDSFALFSGVPVSNDWSEVFTNPLGLDYRDACLLGLAYAREWPTRWRNIEIGIEG